MKKKAFQTSTLALFVTALAMCGKHGSADEPLLVDSIVVDTATSLGKSDAAKFHLDLNIKTFADPRYRMLNISLIDSLLPPGIVDLYDTAGITPRQRVDQYIKSNFSAYKAFYGAVYDEEPHAGTASSSFQLATDVRRNGEGIVNYVATMENVVNAQRIHYSVALNIDLAQRKILSLGDVVEDPTNEEIRKKIVRQLCSQTGFDDMESLQENGYFTHTPPYATNNFVLGNDEITFIYVPGEIADREKGEIKVTVKL